MTRVIDDSNSNELIGICDCGKFCQCCEKWRGLTMLKRRQFMTIALYNDGWGVINENFVNAIADLRFMSFPDSLGNHIRQMLAQEVVE